MKWVRFEHEGQPRFGVLDGESVAHWTGEMLGTKAPTGEVSSADALVWLPPCRPGKIIGLWNNFRAAAEKNGWAAPSEPLYFLKSPSAAVGHGARIAQPRGYDGRVAYEGELVVVIGARASAVPLSEAAAHVFGYTCGNDVTALELIQRDPAFPQWARAKSFDGFAAFGPAIETAFDATSATVRTRVGGRERQNYPLADMFFAPHGLVARLSNDMTLEPGDLIYCGTSVGVLPMKPGTTVEVAIDGIGTLANTYG